jgi:hypothetical protein
VFVRAYIFEPIIWYAWMPAKVVLLCASPVGCTYGTR